MSIGKGCGRAEGWSDDDVMDVLTLSRNKYPSSTNSFSIFEQNILIKAPFQEIIW